MKPIQNNKAIYAVYIHGCNIRLALPARNKYLKVYISDNDQQIQTRLMMKLEEIQI
jgi:hypothetical protein